MHIWIIIIDIIRNDNLGRALANWIRERIAQVSVKGRPPANEFHCDQAEVDVAYRWECQEGRTEVWATEWGAGANTTIGVRVIESSSGGCGCKSGKERCSSGRIRYIWTGIAKLYWQGTPGQAIGECRRSIWRNKRRQPRDDSRLSGQYPEHLLSSGIPDWNNQFNWVSSPKYAGRSNYCHWFLYKSQY